VRIIGREKRRMERKRERERERDLKIFGKIALAKAVQVGEVSSERRKEELIFNEARLVFPERKSDSARSLNLIEHLGQPDATAYATITLY